MHERAKHTSGPSTRGKRTGSSASTKNDDEPLQVLLYLLDDHEWHESRHEFHEDRENDNESRELADNTFSIDASLEKRFATYVENDDADILQKSRTNPKCMVTDSMRPNMKCCKQGHSPF